MTSRRGNKWTINELLSLQREYELLEWTVQQIADKHKRSVEAILFKLESEGFINSWNDARGFDAQQYQQMLNVDESEEVCNCDVTDDNTEIDKLTERVWNLETSVSQINSLVKQMFDEMVSRKNAKNTKKFNYL